MNNNYRLVLTMLLGFLCAPSMHMYAASSRDFVCGSLFAHLPKVAEDLGRAVARDFPDYIERDQHHIVHRCEELREACDDLEQLEIEEIVEKLESELQREVRVEEEEQVLRILEQVIGAVRLHRSAEKNDDQTVEETEASAEELAAVHEELVHLAQSMQ